MFLIYRELPLSDKKQKIVADLQKLMRAKRAEIDPRVLKQAQAAAERSQGLKPKGQTVPYDRAAATKAVELFLKAHPEQKKFREKLLQMIKKDSH